MNIFNLKFHSSSLKQTKYKKLKITAQKLNKWRNRSIRRSLPYFMYDGRVLLYASAPRNNNNNNEFIVFRVT